MRREKPPTGPEDDLGHDAPDTDVASSSTPGPETPGLARSGKPARSGTPLSPRAPTLSQQDAADYVRDISRQLAVISTNAGLDLLAYLLDMVCVEAELVKARKGDRPKD